MFKTLPVSYFRNFIFGVEDSLVSTVGLLSGIAIANVPRPTIFLTGVVLIFVEAFSMAAGTFLSEHSAEGYVSKAERPSMRSAVAAVIMFLSYFVCGFIPLLPYVVVPGALAFPASIGASLIALFLLGLLGATISGVNMLRNAIRMLVIGGVAIGLGILVGRVLSVAA